MKKTEEKIINRYNPSFNMGLTNDEVNERINDGLVNKIKKKYGKSYFQIIVNNFCTLFNFIYLVIIFLLVSSERYMINHGQEIHTSILKYTFVIVVVINLLIGTIQEIKSKRTISRLKLISTPKVRVIRNGEEVEIRNEELVLDDIIVLKSGNEITTDSILISGEIEVNESQLTGESVSIAKAVGDSLYSGSFVVSGSAYVKVERIGEDNQIEKLSKEAQKYKKPNSQILSTLRTLIKFITIFLIITGILMILEGYNFVGFKDSTSGFGYFLYHNIYEGILQKVFPRANSNWYTVITSTCTALLGMIPAGLLMMTSGALVLGVIRLSGHQTLVQDIYCVEMLARVDTLCLDKTGTITSGKMNVVNFEDLSKDKYDVKKIIGEINYALKEENSTAKALENYFGLQEIKDIEEIIPFSSDRKFSGIRHNGEVFLIGAPEFVLRSSYDKYADKLSKKANNGYRILALVVANDYKENKPLKHPKLLAFIYIEDEIRPEAEETIRYFRENGVNVKIISGDNPITVAEVARRVGVAGADNFLSLDGMSDDEVYAVADKYTVFGRVKPHQKQILVKSLKDHKHCVAMTGDGVNDILALKEADCSIAMASGSDAVRSVAQLVLLDSNFASMPKVVGEGRRAINNVQQISMLYLIKTFFILALALLTVLGFFYKTSGDPTFPFSTTTQLLMLELFVIGIPSVYLTIQPNTARVSGHFLKNVLKKSLPGAVAIVLGIIITYSLHKICGFDIKTTKTIVVLVATFIGLMILYLACRPLNKKKYALVISMFLICLFITIQSMTRAPRIRIFKFDLSDFLAQSFDLDNLVDHRIATIDNMETIVNTRDYCNNYKTLLENIDYEENDYLKRTYQYASQISNSWENETNIHISTTISYLTDIQEIFITEKKEINYYLDLMIIDIPDEEERIIARDYVKDFRTLYLNNTDYLSALIGQFDNMNHTAKYNFTPILLAYGLVASSFIIMSITSYFIDFLDRLHLLSVINNIKESKNKDEDDIKEFIEHEDE